MIFSSASLHYWHYIGIFTLKKNVFRSQLFANTYKKAEMKLLMLCLFILHPNQFKPIVLYPLFFIPTKMIEPSSFFIVFNSPTDIGNHIGWKFI